MVQETILDTCVWFELVNCKSFRFVSFTSLTVVLISGQEDFVELLGIRALSCSLRTLW